MKTAGAGALHWSGADRLVGNLNGVRQLPLVIGYHRVVENFSAAARTSIPAMLISTTMLERQLDWVGRRFRYVSLDELAATMEQGRRFDRPAAVVTFDDGYRDVYENAFPLLRRKGIPSAIFVVSDTVSSSRTLLHDRLYIVLQRALTRCPPGRRRLARMIVRMGVWPASVSLRNDLPDDPYSATQLLLGSLTHLEVEHVVDALEGEMEIQAGLSNGFQALTWGMLDEMRRAGVTIGSHTRTHPLLPNESASRILDEVRGSRQTIERKLGVAVNHFAYPCGRFDQASLEAVAAAGYRYAYTTCRHRDRSHPLLTIPRKVLWENSSLGALGAFSSSIMSCHVNGVLDLLAPCLQDHGQPEYAAACSAHNVA